MPRFEVHLGSTPGATRPNNVKVQFLEYMVAPSLLFSIQL